MHNGQLADPMNPIVKEIGKITSKKKNMTQADRERTAKLEFLGGLYLDNGKPCIPSNVIEGTFLSAGRQTRDGKKVLSGLQVRENALLEYDGQRTPEKLWEDPDYRLTTLVNINRGKVVRCRPKFDKWKTSFIVEYDDSILNEEAVIDMAKQAGNVGFGDWRPKFGRFRVEKYTSM